MIPIASQPEPLDFNANVRVPGRAYLARVPNPTGKQFAKKPFWRASLQGLKIAYNSVCAYSCIWIPNNYSVDHFEPKIARPDLAYEWSNYRLAHDRINSNKGDYTDVLDPFHIQNGWFILDFATLWVHPEPTLLPNVKGPVQVTIDRLRLNDDQWVQMRFELLDAYLDGDLKIVYLSSKYPFMAAEILRQGLQPR